MENKDVVRVSELGGWSRSGTNADSNFRIETPNIAAQKMPTLQDSAYESNVSLKDYLESLSRYKWHAFFFAVLVFVVGLLVWLQTYQMNYTAESSLLKKSMSYRNYTQYTGAGLFETWQRSIQGDVTYMRSDYVYNVAKKITQCIASLSLDERKMYLEILIGEAVGDSKLDPTVVPIDKWKHIRSEINESDRYWFALDWDTTMPISYDNAIKNIKSIVPKDSLIIPAQQMRKLILNYWGDEVLEEKPTTNLKSTVISNQNAVIGSLKITSDKESGQINIAVTDLNEAVAVYISNLMPTAFVTANNRIVVTKNHRELAILESLTEDAKNTMADAKDAWRAKESEYDNEIKTKVPAADYGTYPLDRDTTYAAAVGKIAEKTNEQKKCRAIIESLERSIKEYETLLRLLMNPYTEKIGHWKQQRTIELYDKKPDSPDIKRIDGIIANLEKQSDDWLRLNAMKDITEIYNPDDGTYYLQFTYSILSNAKSDKTQKEKEIEILQSEIDSIQSQLSVLADEAGLSEVDRAKIEYDAQKEQHATLMKMLQNINFQSTNIPELFQWSKTASLDKIAARDTKFILILIGFIAVLLGLIFARIADVLDTRIKTDLQVKEISPYPILAHIPILSSSERYITPDSRGTTMHRLAANLFGILGVDLRLDGQKKPDRTIAVTSSLPREGKSFVAFNLAAYYAIEGFKTLLLVADLRNPTLEPFPEMVLTTKPGYLDYLDAKESEKPMLLDEIIMNTYIENLHVIGPGTLKNINPTRLFDQEYFKAYLDELLEHFDTIIIDSPPLMPVVDSSLILKCVKSAIMVLNMGRVKKKDFEDTIRRLQLINAPIAGLVINRDQYAVRRKYYAYYSSGYISGI